MFLVFQAIWAQNPISIDSITTHAGRNHDTHPDSAQYYLHKGIALAEAQGDFYKKEFFSTSSLPRKPVFAITTVHGIILNTLKPTGTKPVGDLCSRMCIEIAETYFYMERLDSALYHFKISIRCTTDWVTASGYWLPRITWPMCTKFRAIIKKPS